MGSIFEEGIWMKFGWNHRALIPVAALVFSSSMIPAQTVEANPPLLAPQVQWAQAAAETKTQENILTVQEVQRLELELEQAIGQCQSFQEKRLFNDCMLLLDTFQKSMPKFKHEELTRINRVVAQRRDLVVKLAQLPPLNPEQPHVYYKSLFKAYLSFPEEIFPFDEVLPIWQNYMLDASAKSKFKKYQTVRVLARNASDGDEAVQALFNQFIQDRFYEYGFKLVDLNSTAPPSGARREILVKMKLKGEVLSNIADATLGQSHYKLVGDITSIRYTDPSGKRLPPRSWEIIETAYDADEARRTTIEKMAPQVADAVFFLTLQQMFSS